MPSGLRRVTGALIALSLLSAGMGAGTAAAVPQAPPTVNLTMTDAAVLTPGQPFTVIATGVTRRLPLTIQWGDGRQSTLASRCSSATARRHPKVCTASATHVYALDGVHELVVRQGTTVLLTRSVRSTSAQPSAPAPVPTPTPTPTPTAAAEPTRGDTWRTEMLSMINALRSDHGVKPLAMCASLERAASDYAQYMGAASYFAHEGPDGSTPSDRARSAGFTGNAVGENIAAGYTDAVSVMNGWKNSPGHYANLINANYNYVGFGMAPSNDKYQWYWVQDFGHASWC